MLFCVFYVNLKFFKGVFASVFLDVWRENLHSFNLSYARYFCCFTGNQMTLIPLPPPPPPPPGPAAGIGFVLFYNINL